MSRGRHVTDHSRRQKADALRWKQAANGTSNATDLLCTAGLAQRRYRAQVKAQCDSYFAKRSTLSEDEQKTLDRDFSASLCGRAKEAPKLASAVVAAWKRFQDVMQSHTAAGIRSDGGRVTGICAMAHANGDKIATCKGAEKGRGLPTCSVVVSQSVRDAEEEYNHAVSVLERYNAKIRNMTE